MSRVSEELPDRFRQLMMKKVDGEISPSEEQQLAEYLQSDPQARHELDKMMLLKKETTEMKAFFSPDMAWEDYWQKLYNRLERGFSWILIGLGAILLGGYGLYQLLVVKIFPALFAASTPLVLKIGIPAFFLGVLILLVSVIRERLLNLKTDKYRKVKR